MKRVLFIGIAILIGLVLSGCVYTCHDDVAYQRRERVVRVVEHRGHHPQRPMRHHRRPVAPPWHRR